ncbi:MAG TPA: tail fiber protein [Saprospiraceae bacterium]|nr:tail fiber protein [Saprospiraceae bacterium]
MHLRKIILISFSLLAWSMMRSQNVGIDVALPAEKLAQNTALFAILGTYYGGNGSSIFALPDLRGTAAIGSGVAVPAGYQWNLGERTN